LPEFESRQGERARMQVWKREAQRLNGTQELWRLCLTFEDVPDTPSSILAQFSRSASVFEHTLHQQKRLVVNRFRPLMSEVFECQWIR
jgi:hypothetical protein